MPRHQHDYYELTSKQRRAVAGEGGIVMCRNNSECVHFLEPRAMQLFRDIVAAGKTPVIREYQRTFNRRTNRLLVAIYPKPARKPSKGKK